MVRSVLDAACWREAWLLQHLAGSCSSVNKESTRRVPVRTQFLSARNSRRGDLTAAVYEQMGKRISKLEVPPVMVSLMAISVGVLFIWVTSEVGLLKGPAPVDRHSSHGPARAGGRLANRKAIQ